MRVARIGITGTRIMLLAVLAATLLMAGLPVCEARRVPSKRTGDLTVIVHDGNGKHVAGAAVHIKHTTLRIPAKDGATGRKGKVTFSNVRRGKWKVTVSKGQDKQVVVVELAAGHAEQEIKLSLSSSSERASLAKLCVHVYNKAGHSVTGATVSVKDLGQSARQTDHDGETTFSEVPVGSWQVTAKGPQDIGIGHATAYVKSRGGLLVLVYLDK